MRIPIVTISDGMEITDMEAELHRIESEAYGAILRALTAQGGPTWDHLDTLYGLRKELRITDAEHRDLIAKAKTDNSVIMLRQWRQGTVEEKELPPNTVNPPPPVSSTNQASSKRMKTLHVPGSTFSHYLSDAQPLPAAISSSLAPVPATISSSLRTHFTTPCGGEVAVFSSRESTVRPKNSVCFKRQASIVSKGMTIQSKNCRQLVNIDDAKKRLDKIEVPVTNKLIHEVERLVYCGNHPDEARVEKAKSLLKEQERAIIEALGRLAVLIEVPDIDNSGHHHDEQQRNGHQLMTPYAMYGHSVDNTKGYYNSALNVPPRRREETLL